MAQLSLFGPADCETEGCNQPVAINRWGYPLRFCSADCSRRQWRRAHQAELNRRARERYNPETQRVRWANYSARNRDYLKERDREWIRSDRGRACQAAFHVRNREARLAANKLWRQANADRRRKMWNIYTNARRGRELNAPGSYTRVQWEARWAYYGGRCWMCGTEADTMDHVVALARGGSNWPANLRPACRSCNSAKGHRPWRNYERAET